MTGSVFKRGSTWTAKVELPRDPLTGQRRTRWLGGYDTKKQAERAALELRAAMLTGTWAQAPRELTVARFLLDQWLPLVEGRDLKESTKAAYQMTVTSYVVPRIGHVPLVEVTPMVIERLLADLRTQGRTLRPGGLAAKTRRNVHGVLHKAFGDALRNGLINRNPLDAVIPHATPAPNQQPAAWPSGPLPRSKPSSTTPLATRSGPSSTSCSSPAPAAASSSLGPVGRHRP